MHRTHIAGIAIALGWIVAPAAHADNGGTVQGTLGPRPPRHAVVWIEGAPANSWTPPKEIVTLSQRGARFNPEFVVVTVGQTVRMPNDDRLIHNVFSVSAAKKFDLGHYPQGESRTVLFDKPGIIDLFCNIHENMHATIAVTPSTFYAVTDGEGRFSMKHVPPGTYKLNAYSPDAGTASATVKVSAGATSTLHLTVQEKK